MNEIKRFVIKLYILLSIVMWIPGLQAQESRSFSWLHPKPQGQSIRNIFTVDAEKWYGVTLAGDFIRTTDAGITWKITENIAGTNQLSGNSNSLNDVHMFDEKIGIVCGDGGILSRTTDAGVTWTSHYHPDRTNKWYDIFFLDSKTGFVCGQAGNGIRMTTNAGINWSRVDAPVIDALSFYALNEVIYYFTSTNGKVFFTEDGGNNWQESYTGSNDTLWKINFLDKKTAVVCGTSNTVKISVDKCGTWHHFTQNLPQNTWYDIDFQKDNTFTPVSESFEDETFPPEGWANLKFSGVSMWERSTVSPYLSPACVWSNYDATGGDNVLMTPEIEILRDDKLIFHMRRSYTGTIFNWDSLQVYAVPSGGNTTRDWMSLLNIGLNISDTSASTYPPRIGTYKKYEIYLGKLTGQKVRIVFRHKNTDGTGVRLDEILAGSYRSSSATRIYLTGNSSNVYKNIIDPLIYLEQPWLPISFINSSQIYKGPMLSTSVIGEDSLIISGKNGSLNRSFPFSGNEAYSDRTTENNLFDIWSSKSGENIISIGSSGNVLTSSNAGTSWDYSKLNNKSLYSISMIDDAEGWISGADGFLYKTTNGGKNWSSDVSHRAINLQFGDFYEVNFADNNTGWAFDANAKIIKTTNGGKKWMLQASGLPDDIRIYDSFVEDIYTVYFIGSSGTVGKTTDGGSNWFYSKFSENNLRSIHMVNSNTGWICGEKGILLKTTNAGKVWDKIELPSYPNTGFHSIKFIDEYKGLIAGTSGKTFRTNDGGVTWTFENSGATDHYAISMVSSEVAYIASSAGNIIKYTEKSSGTRPGNDLSINNIPSKVTLYQNYPNPFNPSTQIKFALPTQSIVSLTIYDISGRLVATLLSNENFNAGIHSKTFSASNLSSGVYFSNLKVNGTIVTTGKMLLVK